MYRIDKTALLLIMATSRFDVIKFSCTLVAFKTYLLTLFELQQIDKMSSTGFRELSLPFTKTWDRFVLRKISPCFVQCNF